MKVDSVIESKTNKKYKFLKSLLNKKFREKEKLFFAEGIKVIEESLDFVKPEFIALSENFDDEALLKKLTENACEIYYFSENLFKNLTDTLNSQGIIGYYKHLHISGIDDIKKGKYLYLDQLQDPGNIGTLIRSAIAFNLDGIIFSSDSVEIYNPKLIRSTMASIFKIKIYLLDRKEDLEKLKDKKFEIITTSLDLKNPSYNYEFSDDFILVLGNEANGVSDYLMSIADRNIYIPISENLESLNVGVAGSIIMYEINRKW